MKTAGTLLFLVFAFGCGGGRSDGTVNPPSLAVRCEPAQAGGCAGNHLPVFVGLTSTVILQSCESYLYPLTSDVLRRMAFTVSTNCVSRKAGAQLAALADHWRGSAGEPVQLLRVTEYRVCAFVDGNGNGRLDEGEPIADGWYTPGQPGYVLSTWHPAR